MPLVTNDGLAVDRWRRAAASDPLTGGLALLVPLDRLDEALAEGVQPVGVEVHRDSGLGLLVRRLHSIALIAVRLDGFTGERACALARELRRLGFDGRLRAVGHDLGDDMGVLEACGFDEIEIDVAVARRRPEVALNGASGPGPARRRRVARERIADALAVL